MARRILLIQAHPDPDPARLCRALADAYAEGAAAAGHEAVRLDLAALDVPPLRSQAAFEGEGPPASLRDACAAIAAAQHLVFVFPLWLGGPPALLKAFLEQVMRPGVAFRYRPGRLPEKLLAGRTARLVVTMGMPAVLYRLWYRSHGLKALEQGILGFVGIRTTGRSLFGGAGAASPAHRTRWLEAMRALGRRGI